jgi:hypothetical protein
MFMDQVLVQGNDAWSIPIGWNNGGAAGGAFSRRRYAND